MFTRGLRPETLLLFLLHASLVPGEAHLFHSSNHSLIWFPWFQQIILFLKPEIVRLRYDGLSHEEYGRVYLRLK